MAISDDKVRATITMPKILRTQIEELDEKDMKSFSQYITVQMSKVVEQEKKRK